MGRRYAPSWWREIIALGAAVPLIMALINGGVAYAATGTSLVCSNQHLGNCPKAGLYTPAGDPVIFNDNKDHYRIIWSAAYVVAPPKGQEPVWFLVYTFYENYGKRTLYFHCPSSQPNEKEWFYRDGRDIGYVPASLDSCGQNPNQHIVLRPGHMFESYAKFNNVPWKGDRIAIEWPQPQKPHATSAFVNPYGIYRWAAASKTSSEDNSNKLEKLLKFAGMIWQVVGVSNMVCDIVRCKFVPPNVTKFISKVGDVQTIGDLALAIRKAFIVGSDLSALNKTINGHKAGQPFSVKAKAKARRAWNDTRSLQETLEDLVPGLAAIWPVPPPK